MASFRKMAQYRDASALQARIRDLSISLPLDEAVLTAAQGSPLAQSLDLSLRLAANANASFRLGNRWCIHPMEGWDAQPDGSPSELTLRRWRRFGLSGAKWIWGGEAAAVVPQGRANPNQTLGMPSNERGLARLRETLVEAHREVMGDVSDLLVGLQLTHSGRFSKPHGGKLEPRIAWHHPILDARSGITTKDSSAILSDAEIPALIEAFVAGARTAARVGFQFVDIKACHGYLLHEFLGAVERPGRYGGDLQGRSRLLLEIIGAIRTECPELAVGVRLNAFDCVPFEMREGEGKPVTLSGDGRYPWGFGIHLSRPHEYDLTEVIALLRKLQEAGVFAVNLTGGTPYTTPHWQRPAAFPPSDGYPPPEDPLVGVARHAWVGRELKRAVPELPMVGSGYTYLQEFLPQVGQAVIREGWIDAVGIGRMTLSYPEMPREVLESGQLRRKAICRTFSDCTTAARQGRVSGCYPLDSFYKELP